MTYFVGIVTCNRRREVQGLLEQLSLQSYEHPGLSVMVIDDASDETLIETVRGQELFRRLDWSYFKHRERYGKPRFWETYDELLQAFLSSGADHFVSLPDDCTLSRAFFRALDTLFAMGVNVINFHRDSRHAHGCWCSGPPARTGLQLEVDGVSMTVDRVGWVDGFTAASRSAVETIGRLERVDRDWVAHPQLGSGVGHQVTMRLRAAGVPVHSPSRSLVRHLEGLSQMNPVARKKHALETMDFFDDA